ncbi:MAG: SGNH/GDSL hydrolase family protein [Candidatus Eremiobacteraeota bacterium]|nr:SGNH/GDSL hydrolase family protein [Candidatus Eremiobacteraeota bacterium]
MKRLTLFVKGNLDVRDTLHSLRIGGRIEWNGANEIVRDRFPGVSVRIQHELFTRSDALLAATGAIPAGLEQRELPLEPYTLASQFGTALFETDADAFVLSIQPDVMTHLVRHRADGYLFYPNARESWPPKARGFVDEAFEAMEPLDVESSMRNFGQIIERIRRRSDAPILIYNLSPVIPGEVLRFPLGLSETLSTRIRRFNLGLIELAGQTDVAIVDVDTLVARAGADRVKLDALHLNAAGSRLVAEEVIAILEEQGCF